MIRDGKQNAFVREFGRMAFDHAVHDSRYAEVFDGAMSSYSRAQTDWVLEALESYDFTKITHLCDVGGGHGYMLCRFLEKHPSQGNGIGASGSHLGFHPVVGARNGDE